MGEPSRNWADTGGRPSVRYPHARTHTHTRSRRTHAPARARQQTVRTRRDQSSRMRTGRCDGSCSACTHDRGRDRAGQLDTAPRRRCGPDAREPVRGRPPPCRVTYSSSAVWCVRVSVSVLYCPSAGLGFPRGACEKARQIRHGPHVMDVKKRYIWSDRETEHFIRLIIDMGMTNMLDSKR